MKSAFFIAIAFFSSTAFANGQTGILRSVAAMSVPPGLAKDSPLVLAPESSGLPNAVLLPDQTIADLSADASPGSQIAVECLGTVSVQAITDSNLVGKLDVPASCTD